MQRYYLNVLGPYPHLPDQAGEEFPSLAAVLVSAEELIAEIRDDPELALLDPALWRVEILDARRELVATVPFLAVSRPA